MSQDKHITSHGIRQIQTGLVEDVIPTLDELLARIDETPLHAIHPGHFSSPSHGSYDQVQNDCKALVQKARTVVVLWDTALTEARGRWIKAEEASTVKYV
jgi:hypothetical protein